MENKKEKMENKKSVPKKSSKKIKNNSENFPKVNFVTDHDIAMDFAEKVYQKYDKLIKSIILFGSVSKNTAMANSDIDIIILLDDAIVKFDDKLTMWYREELGRLVKNNPYNKELHINTIKLTTWWNDLLKGDPTIINILRFGEPIIDFGGFFNPLKILLQQGKLKPTPESMYSLINRVPEHIMRSKISEMSSIEGCYWAIIETSQALLMSIKIVAPSPDSIPKLLREHFVSKGLLKSSYADYAQDIYDLHKKILHNEVKDIDGKVVDTWQNKSEEFFKVSLDLIQEIVK